MTAACPRLGFTVRLRLPGDAASGDHARLMHDLRTLLESRGLSHSSSARSGILDLTIWREGSQSDHLDREAVRTWAAARPDIAESEVGLLVDLDLTG
jgi:uncharacterized protein YggL (DUF469 family)